MTRTNEIWIAVAGLVGIILGKLLDGIFARFTKQEDALARDRELVLKESRDLREELRKEVKMLNDSIDRLTTELKQAREELQKERELRETLSRQVDTMTEQFKKMAATNCDHVCGLLSDGVSLVLSPVVSPNQAGSTDKPKGG